MLVQQENRNNPGKQIEIILNNTISPDPFGDPVDPSLTNTIMKFKVVDRLNVPPNTLPTSWNGIDTSSYFDFGGSSESSTAAPTPGAAATHNLPSAGALASSGGAIVSRTFKLLLGTVSAVGNFFIVLFLGLTFAAQPGVYRKGLLFMAPARHRPRATMIVDRIGETLERWLIAQIVTMFAVFAVTSIGLAIIGIQGAFILGIQAGLLAFIPTLGALIAGLIVVLAGGTFALGLKTWARAVRPVYLKQGIFREPRA